MRREQEDYLSEEIYEEEYELEKKEEEYENQYSIEKEFNYFDRIALMYNELEDYIKNMGLQISEKMTLSSFFDFVSDLSKNENYTEIYEEDNNV